VLIAGGVVLLSNAVALFQAGRNRLAQPEAVVEVSERELQLNWVSRGKSHRHVTLNFTNLGQDWFAQERLEGLGFNVSHGARWRPVRPAFVALSRMAPDARFIAIDADRDAARLRARHPDRSTVLILRATIRAYSDGRRLSGAAAQLVPANISVPPGLAEQLRPVWPTSPRFAMRIAVGPNYEPYIAGFRLLPAK
jgi:hypothetical protein